MQSQSFQTDQKARKDPFFGRMLDTDGHFYMEPPVYDRLFSDTLGPEGGGFVMDYVRKFVKSDEHREAKARNRQDLWEVKGLSALGAVDPHERVEALDALGVQTQLVFPNTFGEELRIDAPWARESCSRFNDFTIDWSSATGWRARGLCQINMGDVDWACREVERVAKKGAKGLVLPCNRPPAGVSPSHEMWDPFWARVQEADLTATIHLGGQGLLSGRDGDEMLPERGWGLSSVLKTGPGQRPDMPIRAGGEEAISPYFMLVAHMAPELFLQTMVMGGVFERFPRLRFGVIEFGAGWVGPAVERMDIWVDFQAKLGVKYDMRPSEYMERNVRVTPFWHEDLAKMVERYGMPQVYTYSTDYPHLEGSKDPIGKFRKWLDRMDPSYPEDFFVNNGQLLLP
jgi:predicted TIM-barrel fold metal-dependent hydrolase